MTKSLSSIPTMACTRGHVHWAHEHLPSLGRITGEPCLTFTIARSSFPIILELPLIITAGFFIWFLTHPVSPCLNPTHCFLGIDLEPLAMLSQAVVQVAVNLGASPAVAAFAGAVKMVPLIGEVCKDQLFQTFMVEYSGVFFASDFLDFHSMQAASYLPLSIFNTLSGSSYLHKPFVFGNL